MMPGAYLVAILASTAGLLFLSARLRLPIARRRLLLAGLATVPLFLLFDAVGSARGWFRSSPRLNLVIFPPGVPLEEPFLLAFLVLISIVLAGLAARALRER